MSQPAESEASRLQSALPVAKEGAKKAGSALWAAGSYLYERYATEGARGAAPSAAKLVAEDGAVRGLGSAEVLHVANTLDGIFASGELAGGAGALKQPEVPRLVVVGTQSSGKSSLLNGIMGADILPLGEQMVTRAPLSLQLVHTPDPAAMRAEFGAFGDGGWCVRDTIALTCPDPTTAQSQSIRDAIDRQTEARAGAQKGVSAEAIYMRLYSPHVPNLSLVDLPGLTMTALTAQGQPKDIKQQIRDMAASYIRQSRTIILMVCPARADLEADPAVELAREYDPSGERTVGILTKTDLMNTGTDVARYLTGAVATDLQLSLGYFACRMRGPSEASLTVREGYKSEAAYFANHAVYGRAVTEGGGATYGDRLGVPALSSYLSCVLLQRLKATLPSILQEVNSLYAATEKNLAELGSSVPVDEGSRNAHVQHLVASFCRDYIGALTEKRADVKTGRKIKDAFTALVGQLRAVEPFDPDAYPDAYLLEAIRDCEGIHLSFPVPPIELLEHMMIHPERRPVRQLLPPCLSCLGEVHEELRALCSTLIRRAPLSRFPKLQARLREEVETLLEKERACTQTKLEELIEMEEAYNYTEDPTVLAELSAAEKKWVSRLDAPLLRSILTSYFATTTRAIAQAAPKAIMLHMVRATHSTIHATISHQLIRPGSGAESLLDEPPDIDAKRRSDMELLARLRIAKRALESMSYS